MDPRLRAAVAASVQWYDDVFAALGVPAARIGGLWVAHAEPPRWHSAVKTLRPGVPTEAVLDAMAAFATGTVADSFGDQDLDAAGFALLIDATWLHLPAGGPASPALPSGWRVVDDPAARARWNAERDTDIPAHHAITVLGRYDGDLLIGGTVVHDAGVVAGVSNSWGADWPEVVAVARAVRPGLPISCYAAGSDRDAAVLVGFEELGPQRVWIRSGPPDRR